MIELAESGVPLQDFLKRRESGLEPGRARALQPRREPQGRGGAVRLPRDLHARLSAHGKAQHLPLGQALREYAGAANKELLLAAGCRSSAPRALRLAESDGRRGRDLPSAALVAAGGAAFLGDVPALERAGVVVRMPATWR